MGHYDNIREQNDEDSMKSERLSAVIDSTDDLMRYLNKSGSPGLDIDLLFKLRAEAFTKMKQLKAAIDQADDAIHDLVVAGELDIHFKR